MDEIINDLANWPTAIYGHKKRLLRQILELIPTHARTLAEPFGGTGIVSAAVKRLGLAVHTNDIMQFQHSGLRALVANNNVVLSDDELGMLSSPNPNRGHFIQDNYRTFFGDDNAAFLDSWAANIAELDDTTKRDIAVFLPPCTVMMEIEHNRCRTSFSPTGTLTGNRHLRGINLADRVWRRAHDMFPALLHDNGQCNTASNMDAVEFLETVEADVLYIDSPYSGCVAADYEVCIPFYEKLTQIMRGEGATIRRFRNTKCITGKHKRFVGRTESIVGLADLFSAAIRTPLVILSYNRTSTVAPEEIGMIAEAYGFAVTIHDIEYSRPTTVKGGQNRTVEVLLECRRAAHAVAAANTMSESTAEAMAA